MTHHLYFNRREEKLNNFKIDKKLTEISNDFLTGEEIEETLIKKLDKIEGSGKIKRIKCQKCSQKLRKGEIFHTSADNIFEASIEVTLCKKCSMKQKTAKAL